jgi:sugar lactone lactonase YvrE
MHAPAAEERIAPFGLNHPGSGRVQAWPVRNRVGESPVWHAGEQALYWIDVRGPEVLRLDPAAGHLTRWRLPDVVGALALRRGGTAWLAMRRTLVELELATGQLRDVAEVAQEPAHNRLNDGKASPSGRWFVFGSMDDRPDKQPTGRLYRADANGAVEVLADALVVANGIAFSRDASRIWYSDSARGLLMAAPWDEGEGRMGQSRVIARLDEAAGRPDGGTVDEDDAYWSAGVSAGVLHRLDSAGRVLARLALPCRAPTMCVHGGAQGRTLFVTSLVRPQWEAPGACDGALLAIEAPTVGLLVAQLL